jgi:Dolichyl-phosphate-mannose-protein mannosyltransferase
VTEALRFAQDLMVTTQEPISVRNEIPGSQLQSYIKLASLVVMLLGLFARLWAAFGTFLNPDEALHFRLANQPSLVLAYKASLTASHPPLLTLVLYFWRGLGTSELWLRLPLVLASTVFCWMFYRWLTNAAGYSAGLIGLLFVALLTPIVLLSSEIRQYPLLLAFLASALYFLDYSLETKSTGKMVAFTLCLYLRNFPARAIALFPETTKDGSFGRTIFPKNGSASCKPTSSTPGTPSGLFSQGGA